MSVTVISSSHAFLAVPPMHHRVLSRDAAITKKVDPYPARIGIRRSMDSSASLPRQRKSVAQVQIMGLFGLGAAEIGIIVVAAAFIIGPQQISSMAGNMAGKVKGEYEGLPEELKKIPSEFQKGFEEGSVNAKARNAKQMEAIPAGDDDDEGNKK